jgi:hypothetical protein
MKMLFVTAAIALSAGALTSPAGAQCITDPNAIGSPCLPGQGAPPIQAGRPKVQPSPNTLVQPRPSLSSQGLQPHPPQIQTPAVQPLPRMPAITSKPRP